MKIDKVVKVSAKKIFEQAQGFDCIEVFTYEDGSVIIVFDDEVTIHMNSDGEITKTNIEL